MLEGYFGVCGIAVSGVISARYCGIKGKNWRYCGIEFLQCGMRYRYILASKVHEMPFSRQGAQHLRDEFLEERKTQENGHSLCLSQPVQHVNLHPAEETNLFLI